jgi:hypothetical protein
MSWKTVKIPAWAYENALMAKGDVLTRGLGALPPGLLSPRTCPRCDSPLASAPSEADRVRCTRCNYKQERLEAGGTSLTSVGIGVLIGLGLAALFQSAQRPVDTRRTARAQTIRQRVKRGVTAREIDEEIASARTRRRRRSA